MKKIGLLGDYDVDGSASTAIMCSYLKALEVDFEFYIPDRIEDGYGPSKKIMEYLKNKGCELIITLDCGTSISHCADLISSTLLDNFFF